MQKETETFTQNWEKKEAAIKKYNETVTNLNPKYTQFKPYGVIVVRCFHIEPTYINGVFIFPSIPMKEITQNGMGIRKTMDSPWALARKAVVVAVPDGVPYAPGDIVELHKEVTLAVKPSVDHPASLPFAFMMSDWYDSEPPSDPDHEDFGYLAINPYNHIIGKHTNHG